MRRKGLSWEFGKREDGSKNKSEVGKGMAEDRNRIIGASFKAPLRPCFSQAKLYAWPSWASIAVISNFFMFHV